MNMHRVWLSVSMCLGVIIFIEV